MLMEPRLQHAINRVVSWAENHGYCWTPLKFVDIVQSMQEYIFCQIIADRSLSESFEVESWLIQGEIV